MTFLAHGVLGAGFCALPWRWMPKIWRKQAVLIASIFGFIGGIWPDIFDWVAATFFGSTRWEYYTRMHSGDLVNTFYWHPAYAIHLYLDSFIHIKPGYNWWPDFWYLEIGSWVVGIFLLWFSFKERKHDS